MREDHEGKESGRLLGWMVGLSLHNRAPLGLPLPGEWLALTSVETLLCQIKKRLGALRVSGPAVPLSVSAEACTMV